MTSINIGKIYGFDYLRAIGCIIVVAIHSEIPGLLLFNDHIFNIVFYNIFDLAVPIFFQTALVLFFINRQKYPDYFRQKRLFKLVKLYLFWGVVSHIFNLIFRNESYSLFLNQPITWNNFLQFIFQDGYGNPFYFLFSLLMMTILAELVSLLVDKIQIKSEFIIYPGLIISSIIVFLLPLGLKFSSPEFIVLFQATSPLNFIPYIFSSFLISQSFITQQQTSNIYQINYLQILILLLMTIIFVIIENQYFSQPFIFQGIEHKSLPTYSRLSLVFSAWLITTISLQISSLSYPIIKIVSDLSLGIYCLHTFIGLLTVNSLIKISSAGHLPLPVLLFFTSLISAGLITKFIKKLPIFQDLI